LLICNFYFLGVNDIVKAKKRKSKGLDCGEVTKRKQKQSNVDKQKNEDVKPKKKSRPHKGTYTTLFSKFTFRATHGSFLHKNNFHNAHVSSGKSVFLHLYVKYYLPSIGVKKYLKFHLDMEN